jgi:hypothetical protein
MDEYGTFRATKIGRGNSGIRRGHAAVSLRQPEAPYDLRSNPDRRGGKASP